MRIARKGDLGANDTTQARWPTSAAAKGIACGIGGIVQMAMVVAFVSQKGGVGKSTLARALATSSVKAGLAVKTVDLDPDQATMTMWAQTRDRYNVSPSVKVD